MHWQIYSALGLWTFLIVSAFVAGNAWLFLRGFKNDEQEEISRTGENDDDMQLDEQQESSLSEPLLNDQDDMDEKLEVETPRRKFPFTALERPFASYTPSTRSSNQNGLIQKNKVKSQIVLKGPCGTARNPATQSSQFTDGLLA